MSNINRPSHKDNETHYANTGFVQNEHCSRTTTPNNQGSSNYLVVGLANRLEDYANKLELEMEL
eukprot:12907334-Prorocentrum_lima.AAC.1